MKKVSGNRETTCDNCGDANADHYCKQCAKFLCTKCLQQHNNWMTDHQSVTVDEVVNAAYEVPRAKPDPTNVCKVHSEPLKIFCETCDELICHICIPLQHKDHKHDFLNNAYNNQMSVLESSLHPLDQQIKQVTESIATLTQRRQDIAEQGENTKKLTHNVVSELKELLDKYEKCLAEKVDGAVQYKIVITDHQLKEAKAVLSELTDCKDHVEQSMKVGTPYQILSTKSRLISYTEDLVDRSKKKSFQPLEEANVTLVRNNTCNEEISSHVGKIEYSLNVKPTIKYDHIPIVNQKSTLIMSLSDCNGSPVPITSSNINCVLTPPTNDPTHSVQCTVTDTSQTGQYNVIFTPTTRGEHHLKLKLCNISSGCLVKVPVTIPVKMRNDIVKIIDGCKLNAPHGIAIANGGRIVVAEYYDHCITILSRDGTKVKSFGSHGKSRGQLITS